MVCFVKVTSVLIFVAVFIVEQRSLFVSANLLEEITNSLSAFSLFDTSDVTDSEFPWSRERRALFGRSKKHKEKKGQPKEVKSTKELSVDQLYDNIKVLLLKISDFCKTLKDNKVGDNARGIVEQILGFGYKITYQIRATCLTTTSADCEPCKDLKKYDPKKGCGDHSGTVPIQASS